MGLENLRSIMTPVILQQSPDRGKKRAYAPASGFRIMLLRRAALRLLFG